MKRQATALLVAAVATVTFTTGCQKKMEEAKPMVAAKAPTMTAVKYRVEFTTSWTKANFPFEYPDTSLIHKPHFSGLIGTAHNGNLHLFAAGQTPTPGLERLSEEGKHDPLSAEIQVAIAAGNALALTESDPLKDFSQTVSAEVMVDEAHPMVSLVAMIAPSPDWFVGVSDVRLMDMGSWSETVSVDANAWDSGGDDGATYLADDQDANPKKATTLNQSRHFMKDGQAMPVGRFTFTRM